MATKYKPNYNVRSANLPVDTEIEAAIVTSIVYNAITGQFEPTSVNSTTVSNYQGQYLNSDNSVTRVAADGASQYVGAWTLTRPLGIVRLLTVLASNVASGLGGTFTFEFSEDGITAKISETRAITDFATVRDFDLLNAGKYYRIKFTPSRALTGAEFVDITTTLRLQDDGNFVRLADQELEQDNAAFGSTFSFGKAFDPFTRKSTNLRPQAVSFIPTPAPTTLEPSGVYLSDAIDTLGFSSVRLFVATTVLSLVAGVRLEWSDTPNFAVLRGADPFSFDAASLAAGFDTFSDVKKLRYLRVRYTNGVVGQSAPMFLSLELNSAPFLDEFRQIPLNTGRTGQQDLSLTATALGLSSSPRRALRLKNLTSSARPGFYGFQVAGLTVNNADELAVGESVEFDLDETQLIYVITTSTGGSGVRFSWCELD